jgi:hypothetical protein
MRVFPAMRVVILATLFLFAAPGRGWSWGQEGHSIIAEIADLNLTARAKAQVSALLGQNASLASVASWADDIRDERPETYNWHFVDIPLYCRQLRSQAGLSGHRSRRLRHKRESSVTEKRLPIPLLRLRTKKKL